MANISIRIPDEVRTYKETIMFGLTARQLICTALTLLICVPLFYFGNGHIDNSIELYIKLQFIKHIVLAHP